jgi:hypothetical protein
MKGLEFKGSLNEGDEVEIRKRPREGKTLSVKKLRNLTAGCTFKAWKGPILIRIANYPAMLIYWLVWVLFVGGFFWLVWIVVQDLMQ